jgi:hypothetical protein
VVDMNLDECKQLMRRFIQTNPDLWSEDIGELCEENWTTLEFTFDGCLRFT